jgi:hypothetical protein
VPRRDRNGAAAQVAARPGAHCRHGYSTAPVGLVNPRFRGLHKAGNLGDWAASLTFRIAGSKAHPRVEVVQP